MNIDYYDKCKIYLNELGLSVELLNDTLKLEQTLKEKQQQLDFLSKKPSIEEEDNIRKQKYEKILTDFPLIKKTLLRNNFVKEHKLYSDTLTAKCDKNTIDNLNLSLYDFYKFINNARNKTDNITTDSSLPSVQLAVSGLQISNLRNKDHNIRNFSTFLIRFVRDVKNIEEYNEFVKNRDLYFEFVDQIQIEDAINFEINKDFNKQSISQVFLHRICSTISLNIYTPENAVKYANNFINFRGYTINENNSSILVEKLEQAKLNLEEIDKIRNYKDNPPPVSDSEMKAFNTDATNLLKSKKMEILRSLPRFWQLSSQYNGNHIVIIYVISALVFQFYFFAITNSYQITEIIIRVALSLLMIYLVHRYYKYTFNNRLAEEYRISVRLRDAIPLAFVKYLLYFICSAICIFIWGAGTDILGLFKSIKIFQSNSTPLGVFCNVFFIYNLLQAPFNFVAKNKYSAEYWKRKDKVMEEYILTRNQNYFEDNKLEQKISALSNNPILRFLPEDYKNVKVLDEMILLVLKDNLSSLDEVITKYSQMN